MNETDADPDVTNEIDAEVTAFLERVDAAFEEYELGYVDADATLSVVRGHVEELREAIE